MSIRPLNSDLYPLTQNLSVKVSTMEPLPGERPKKANRLEFFNAHVANGTFVSPSWAVVKLASTGMEFRADGQHTSTVLAQLPPEKFPTNLLVTIRNFEIDDLYLDGPAVFDMFDNPHSVRSNTDKIGYYASRYPELRALGERFLQQVAAGVDSWLKDLANQHKAETDSNVVRHSPREYGLYFLDDPINREFAQWLHQWKNSLHNFMISKTGVVSEIRADFATNQDFATEFWGQAFSESNPDPEHETRILTRKLKDWIGQPKKKQTDFKREANKNWTRWARARRFEKEEQEEKQAQERATAKPTSELFGPVISAIVDEISGAQPNP